MKLEDRLEQYEATRVPISFDHQQSLVIFDAYLIHSAVTVDPAITEWMDHLDE